MKLKNIFVLLSITAIVGLFYHFISIFSGDESRKNMLIEQEFKENIRDLMEDRVVWTRQLILNHTDELPGIVLTKKRLIRNQVEIGRALEPYYGKRMTNKLIILLNNQTIYTEVLIIAILEGNTDALEQLKKKSIKNTNEVALLLCKITPSLKVKTMGQMVKANFLFTLDEGLARISKNYKADIYAYDNARLKIREISEAFTDGIIMQFPNKFNPLKK